MGLELKSRPAYPLVIPGFVKAQAGDLWLLESALRPGKGFNYHGIFLNPSTLSLIHI